VGQKSVLTTNVRYSGGSTLTITGEGDVLDIADIEALLGALDPGTARQATVTTSGPSKLELTDALENIKPSEVAAIANVSAERRLALIPAEKEAADLAELTIPAGAEVTITQELPGIKTITVAGTGAITATKQIGGGTGGTDAVTVTLAEGAKLIVAEAIKLDTASKLETGAEIGGEGTIEVPTGVAAPGAVVSGTTVKEDSGKITTVVSGGTALNVANGETAVIKGEIEFTAKITVAEGGALVIPKGNKLTFGTGGEIDGAGKIIVEGTGTATGLPKLFADTTTNNATNVSNPAGIELVSAEKDLKTGGITVKVGGKVDGGFSPWAKTNIWVTDGDGKPAGNWSWAVIDNLLSEDALKANTVIKQTNQALRYYAGANDILTVEPSPANPPTNASGSIYIDATKAYKLRKYANANGAADITPSGATPAGFGVLFWSGASPKTATIEIKPATQQGQTVAPPAYTVIVDWSALTINPAPAK
jgi:hypothetical protein